MAIRSSIIATARSKIFKETGTREPTSAKIARAKAISVAAGIAQPWIMTGSFILK